MEPNHLYQHRGIRTRIVDVSLLPYRVARGRGTDQSDEPSSRLLGTRAVMRGIRVLYWTGVTVV
jgi:hypothetical protein